jgi:peptide-methionine (S)-S-oxide reductase
MKKIVLAGGCFWGVEEYFSRLPGLVSTRVGYANGHTKNPSYQEVCTGTTGHVEACLLEFDETIISLEDLLDKFWSIIDPTIKNRQGNDIGSQYRTGIYYLDKGDLSQILESRDKQQALYNKPIVTEIQALGSFYEAEEYHQAYLKKNPNGYCHIDLSGI